MGKYQEITVNLEPKYRYDTLEDRKCLVVPVTMLTVGVHNGSQGELFYPEDELSSGPQKWDHKPIVVNHPQINGRGISACDPDVINSRKIGILLKTRYENGLKAEAWIDEEKANKVDSRVVENILAGNPMEVSTGLFTENEIKEGVWNEESYVAIARNHVPDHLAILPDEVGSCSLADGAGLLVNAEKELDKMNQDDLKSLLKLVYNKIEQEDQIKEEENVVGNEKSKIVDYLCSNCKTVRGLSVNAEEPENCKVCDEELFKLSDNELVDNEMSFDEIRSAVRQKIEENLGIEENEDSWVFLMEEYPTYVIYEYEARLYIQSYSRNNDEVTLEGEPVEVERVAYYEPVQNINSNTEEDKEMKKEDLVEGLIANESVAWTEENREELMDFEESEILAKIPTIEPEPVENEEQEEEVVEEEETEEETEEEPVENSKPMSVEEFVENAPPEIKDYLQEGLDANKQTRSALIRTITSNERNEFSEKYLKDQPTKTLRSLAKLATKEKEKEEPVANFEGMGEVPNKEEESEEALVAPTMNFDKE